MNGCIQRRQLYASPVPTDVAETEGKVRAMESKSVFENVFLRQDKELGNVLLEQLAAGGAAVTTGGSTVVLETGATTCGAGNGGQSEASKVM